MINNAKMQTFNMLILKSLLKWFIKESICKTHHWIALILLKLPYQEINLINMLRIIRDIGLVKMIRPWNPLLNLKTNPNLLLHYNLKELEHSSLNIFLWQLEHHLNSQLKNKAKWLKLLNDHINKLISILFHYLLSHSKI